MELKELLANVSFKNFLPLDLPLIQGDDRSEVNFEGRLLGQEIEVDAGDPELPSVVIRIFETLEGDYLTYLGHFSITEGLWEANHCRTEELDLGKISAGLHLKVCALGSDYEQLLVTNVPSEPLGNAFHRALKNAEWWEKERRKDPATG